MIKCHNFITSCRQDGLVVEPVMGFVSVQQQAEIWSIGKLKEDIEAKIIELELNGCDFLAKLLKDSESYPWNDDISFYGDDIFLLPGFSWHNWGTAIKIEVDGDNAEKIIKRNASFLGLTYAKHGCGIYYTLQSPSKSVYETYSLKFVNDHFKEKLGENEKWQVR